MWSRTHLYLLYAVHVYLQQFSHSVAHVCGVRVCCVHVCILLSLFFCLQRMSAENPDTDTNQDHDDVHTALASDAHGLHQSLLFNTTPGRVRAPLYVTIIHYIFIFCKTDCCSIMLNFFNFLAVCHHQIANLRYCTRYRRCPFWIRKYSIEY